jgi:hypothetical protein
MVALGKALTAAATGTNPSNAIKSADNSTIWGSGTAGGYSPTAPTTTSGWNGAIYVDVEPATSGQLGVVLANGQTSSASTSMLPSLNPDANGNNLGLTVATNAPLYVLGNFNSTGNGPSSGLEATTPDDMNTDIPGTSRGAEIPVSIVADAVTILSPGYFGTPGTNGSSAPTILKGGNTSGTNAYVSASSGIPKLNMSDVEVAASLIAGLVQTNASASSGGVHNLARFIEDWGGHTVYIRGSLVSLYLSRRATGPWSTSYYGAPNRKWGFDQILANGVFPPFTPKVMSYSRIRFTSLTASQYQNLVNGLTW